MALIVYPIFRTWVATEKPSTSGEVLAHEFQALDELAVDYELVPFTAFTDRREIPPDFDGPPWKVDETLGPCDDWFPASEGRAAVAALARLIREDPGAASRLESPSDVADELEDLTRALAVAENVGVEFRLALG